jgi:hypothetical protein
VSIVQLTLPNAVEGPHSKLDFTSAEMNRDTGVVSATTRRRRYSLDGIVFRVNSSPRRIAILLIGGEKVGQDRCYEKFVRLADRLYDEHILELTREGLIDG